MQGLVSLREMEDHVYMYLIENAPFNIGKTKKYIGVCGNLTAYGCKLSLDYGFGGVVAFYTKTALIPHYQKTLGAVLLGEKRMGIMEDKAMILLEKYFPEGNDD